MATTIHPSDRLYRNEVTDFRQALGIVIAGMGAEMRDTERFNATLEPYEVREFWLDPRIFREHGRAAREALAIYEEEVLAAEMRVVERLLALGTNYEGFANALREGDYSILAW